MTLKYGQDPNQNSAEILRALKNNLIAVIKSFAQAQRPRFIQRSLCLGLTYIILQTHNQPDIWSPGSQDSRSLVQALIENLSGTPEEVQSLLTICRYMASECEDDGIVIEESLRESYFDYMDVACDVVFQ